MNRTRLITFLFVCCTIAYAQETKVNFISASEIPVFLLEKIFIEDSENLSSSVDIRITSMKVLGTAPSSMSFENGVYVLNLGGNEEYNKTFVLNADGTEKDVRISGSAKKARDANFWMVGTGLAFLISIQTVPLLNDVIPLDMKYLSLVLPVSTGAGFLISFGSWISRLPRVEISDTKVFRQPK